ncbi:MAG: type III PLP-dependent enzyme [Gammaproteobacteria bacterium]|nr:type III PLP-dependent enzyme [Gammaproteobacteria bacterium]
MKFQNYFKSIMPQTPCMVFDVEMACVNLKTIQELMPYAKVFYAVKANPAVEVLKPFLKMGSYFDVASLPEIQMILDLGGTAQHVCYGNTIKKKSDVEAAFALGVRRFMADSIAEIEKLAIAAPGASVFFRIKTDGKNAQWPLSNKFGASVEETKPLILRANELGLKPFGISFHVGSQQLEPLNWKKPINEAAELFAFSRAYGIELQSLNLGGGFPVQYHEKVPSIDKFSSSIHTYLTSAFPEGFPEIMIEPGRYLVANAGAMFAEVVLIAHKETEEGLIRWVYLDVGKYGGLTEASETAIQYAVMTPRNGALQPAMIAGPTCDSSDILYGNNRFMLPEDLQIGDIIQIQSTGAYTTTYTSIAFNGFSPFETHFIG